MKFLQTAILTASGLMAVTQPAAAAVDFSREILPILSDKCFACHGPDDQARKGRLRLDTKEGALSAGSSGEKAIVPGNGSGSELIRRILSKDPDEVMPPPKSNLTLTVAQTELLRRWIDEGAAWGKHWAYETPVRPEIPAISDKQTSKRVRNPIDNFVFSRLEKEGLSPSPEAPRETLIRRLTLDLTGLPPTVEDVDAFIADKSPDAYEKVVDRLLRSTNYGERWAWDWLDAARYADSNGYQGDPERTMWPWRDWVINAINANMPYDQFTVEQLAGDLLPNASRDQKVASGFNRNNMHNGEGGRIAEETRVENVFDRVETTSTVWMGLTMGCARCHDHKYDPITLSDYYSLYDYFNQISEEGTNRGGGQIPPVIDFSTAEDKARLADLQEQVKAAGAEVDALEKSIFPREEKQTAADSPKAADLSGNLIAALRREAAQRDVNFLLEFISVFKKSEPEYVAKLDKLKKAVEERDRFNARIPRVMVMDQLAKRRDTFILVVGNYEKKTDIKVTGTTPGFLPPLPEGAPDSRLALAQWIVAPENPLTARVTVNRFWQSFFGTGLVKTVEDFGVQGEKPSHPELLDWLATEFVRAGWDVRALHKRIVMSATYRQSSKDRTLPEATRSRTGSETLVELDPENRLLARGARFRMPSWMLRDQALAASGLLEDKLGGPPVKPYQPAGIWEEATFGKKTYKQDSGDALYRRSLYVFWRRIVGPTMFFDSAARQVCEVKQKRTNTPLHALTTLNDITFVEAARALAQRVMESNESAEVRIGNAFRLVTARNPSPAEMKILGERLDSLRQHYAADMESALKLLSVGESKRNEKLNAVEHAAFTGVCLLLLNMDEALNKE